MVTAIAPETGVDLALAVPEYFLIATADCLPGWLRYQPRGEPKLPTYSADRRAQGIWEFRAGRSYFELEHIPATWAGRRDRLEIGVRVIDGAVYAGVRAAGEAFPLDPEHRELLTAIDRHTHGLLHAALRVQLHAVAENKGRGMKAIDVSLTRRLYQQLVDDWS